MKKLNLSLLTIKIIFGIVALLSSLVMIDAIEASQQEKKSWTEWTSKDAEKMLSSSPWAKIQIDTDTSEMFFRPTAEPGRRNAPNASARLEAGATNQATNLKYGIRFFSARPVRRAFVRMLQLEQKQLEPDVIERLKNFAELAPTIQSSWPLPLKGLTNVLLAKQCKSLTVLLPELSRIRLTSNVMTGKDFF